MQGDLPEYAEALVIKDGKIEFVAHLLLLWKLQEGHQMINLEGKTLLPGFIDGHAHFANFSAQAIGAQILPPPDAGAKNIPTLIEILEGTLKKIEL
jgi:predicted amidohydrolase YtcJ